MTVAVGAQPSKRAQGLAQCGSLPYRHSPQVAVAPCDAPLRDTAEASGPVSADSLQGVDQRWRGEPGDAIQLRYRKKYHHVVRSGAGSLYGLDAHSSLRNTQIWSARH